MSTLSNCPFGCRHTRSLSFGAKSCQGASRKRPSSWSSCFALFTATYRATARGGELDSGERDMYVMWLVRVGGGISHVHESHDLAE